MWLLTFWLFKQLFEFNVIYSSNFQFLFGGIKILLFCTSQDLIILKKNDTVCVNSVFLFFIMYELRTDVHYFSSDPPCESALTKFVTHSMASPRLAPICFFLFWAKAICTTQVWLLVLVSSLAGFPLVYCIATDTVIGWPLCQSTISPPSLPPSSFNILFLQYKLKWENKL